MSNNNSTMNIKMMNNENRVNVSFFSTEGGEWSVLHWEVVLVISTVGEHRFDSVYKTGTCLMSVNQFISTYTQYTLLL